MSTKLAQCPGNSLMLAQTPVPGLLRLLMLGPRHHLWMPRLSHFFPCPMHVLQWDSWGQQQVTQYEYDHLVGVIDCDPALQWLLCVGYTGAWSRGGSRPMEDHMFSAAKHPSSAEARKTKTGWMPMGIGAKSASQIKAVNKNQNTCHTERAGIEPARLRKPVAVAWSRANARN